MTTQRRSFKIDKDSPGSEVAAETAAALSVVLSSLVVEFAIMRSCTTKSSGVISGNVDNGTRGIWLAWDDEHSSS